MAYHVEIDEIFVLDYLGAQERGLSIEDLDVLLGFLEDLSVTGESFCKDPSRRCGPGSSHFEVTHVFQDSAGKMRAFRFIVTDAAAAYGVLRVRFAEEL